MTSYNKVNGVWSHYHYDLVSTILRKEWGYRGNVITDWWMQPDTSPEFPMLKNNAYRTRAQVDVLMPGEMKRVRYGEDGADQDQLTGLNEPEHLSRAELQRSAANVLRFALTRLKNE